MFKSPLVRTLQLLTPVELDDLHQFVASPIFNEVHRYRDKLRLFEHLKKYYPDFNHADLAKSSVGKALFPDRSKHISELERTMALLLPIVRQFIAITYFDVRSVRVHPPDEEEIREMPARMINYLRQTLALMRFYGERNHADRVSDTELTPVSGKHNFFPNLYANLSEVFARQQDFNIFDENTFCDVHYLMFLGEYEKAHYESEQQDQRQGDANLLAAVEQLDQFYLITKMHLMTKLEMRQRTSNLFEADVLRQKRLEANFEISKSFTNQLIKDYKYLRTPGISIYLALFEFLNASEPGEASDYLATRFGRLLLRKSHKSAVPSGRLNDFNVLLRNYWVKRYHSTGDLIFLERNHQLHKEQLALVGPQDSIPSSQFQGIILTALKLRKTEWVAQILNDFDPKKIIGEPHLDILMDVLWACLHFAKGDFLAARAKMPHYISYGVFQDGYLYGTAVSWDLKIRYELDILQEEESMQMVKTSTTRIGRFRSLPPAMVERYQGIFSFITKINRYKLNSGKNQDKIKVLKDQIAQTSVSEQEWLLTKCTELLKTENK